MFRTSPQGAGLRLPARRVGAGQAVKSDYNNSFSLPGTGSTTAQQLLAKAVPAQVGDSDTIVW